MPTFATRLDLSNTNPGANAVHHDAGLLGEVTMTTAAAHFHNPGAVAGPGQQADIDLSILVSCYNEEAFIIGTIETIRAALEKVGGLSYEIIVIDDASRDRSAELVQAYIESHPEDRILLRRNSVNRGLAQNYLDAAFIGKGKYYRLICGDNAEPEDTMIAVFREIGAADMLIPYYVSAEGKSRFRRTVSNAYTLLVNAITRYRLHYYNGLAVH